ncbi:hypothetical protein ACLQ24_29115 [Micromonospora sp. DT4]|uniref:hypothetical protein n=1 Tax=Micromonospora sp. DT4 TaxID=3393438 RepID=UPI003CEE6789
MRPPVPAERTRVARCRRGSRDSQVQIWSRSTADWAWSADAGTDSSGSPRSSTRRIHEPRFQSTYWLVSIRRT